MAIAFKKDRNWKKMQLMLDPNKADSIVKKHLKRATKLNGKIAEGMVRDSIKSGDFEANAELTQAIKGQNKPLVGTSTGSQLFNAITSRSINETTVFIGVLKVNDIYNVAVAIHEGASIGVTSRMRGLFFILWQASSGNIDKSKLSGRAAELFDLMPQGWLPLKKSTTAIVVPARQFIKDAFEGKSLRAQAKANWEAALKAAFAEIKANA